MRMKEILIESFKSPFFNLLAIANLILIAIAFTIPLSTPSSKLAAMLKLPAFAAARIMAGPLYHSFAIVPPLVYLQWILIGGFARMIASRVKPRVD